MTSDFVARLTRSPRTLFLVDGVGALITALAVGVVLPALGDLVGMPRPMLRTLALTAAIFAAYSLTCAAVQPRRWRVYLQGIALANASYALVTAVLLVRLRATLQALDWLYFLGEIGVVGALATLELRVARRATPDTPSPLARARS